MTAGWIRWHDLLPTTIDEAHREAALGAPGGTAVAARQQSAARGTRGRKWESPAGGLWMSVIVRPDDPAGIECLGLRVGLAVAALLDTLVAPGTMVSVKWPNDLLIGGRKVAGVLCEARWQGERAAWVVASIGLNMRNEIPAFVGETATRLADHGVAGGPELLAEPIRGTIARAARRSGPLTPAELADFAARDWLKGRRLSSPSGGLADGITEAGLLRVRTEDGAVATTVGPIRVAEE